MSGKFFRSKFGNFRFEIIETTIHWFDSKKPYPGDFSVPSFEPSDCIYYIFNTFDADDSTTLIFPLILLVHKVVQMPTIWT